MDMLLLMEVADKIHKTLSTQGMCITFGNQSVEVGCFHVGPGLGVCEGLARTLLSEYKMVKK